MSDAPIRTDLDALKLAQQRADEQRQHPFWPFGERTPEQMRAFERMQAAYRAGLLVKWPAARF